MQQIKAGVAGRAMLKSSSFEKNYAANTNKQRARTLHSALRTATLSFSRPSTMVLALSASLRDSCSVHWHVMQLRFSNARVLYLSTTSVPFVAVQPAGKAHSAHTRQQSRGGALPAARASDGSGRTVAHAGPCGGHWWEGGGGDCSCTLTCTRTVFYAQIQRQARPKRGPPTRLLPLRESASPARGT